MEEGAPTITVYVTVLPIQALYEPVLVEIPVGVGVPYNIDMVFAVPAIPQAVTPLALKLPPTYPALNDMVTLELSDEALTNVVFAGFVHLKYLIVP